MDFIMVVGMQSMRIIVADDQPDVRSALKLLLEERPGVVVEGEASNFLELFRQVKNMCPELVLLDWELPGTKPEELISALHNLCPQLEIIALSSRPQMRKIALEAGVSEFVCKSDPPENLLTALDNCSRR
jgi:DNA-binding NarL/FixJ family response regulator